MSYRVLITGSRDWEQWDLTNQVLAWAYHQAKELGEPLPILVSGTARGADRMCENIWRAHGLPVEQHPADWDTYGKRAGFVRNEVMVNLGADVCYAFIRNNSNGASMTARLAEQAGIPTIRYDFND